MVSTIKFDHIQEAISAVDHQVTKAQTDNKRNHKGDLIIKASAGTLFLRFNEQSLEVLMGRLNKLNRPNPKDEANVHDSFGLFSGSVEESDSHQKELPTVVATAAREVEEETLGLFPKSKVVELIGQDSTLLLKNAGWKHFTAATFLTRITEDTDTLISEFDAAVKEHPQHEITELKWVPLTHIIDAQKAKDLRYADCLCRIQEVAGTILDDQAKMDHPELKALYNENPTLPTGDKIAHFVSRTIHLAKEAFDQMNPVLKNGDCFGRGFNPFQIRK